MSDLLRVVLIGGAKSALDQMLNSVRADKTVTINASQLANWIVTDYFERFYDKRRADLVRSHFNPRKRIREAMRDGDLVEIKRALEEVTRNLEAKRKAENESKIRSVYEENARETD